MIKKIYYIEKEHNKKVVKAKGKGTESHVIRDLIDKHL